MAGSYNHVVNDEGALIKPDRINGMLNCMSGDVVECVEEMYGMIWYLADQWAKQDQWEPDKLEETRKWLIEDARTNYKFGLKASPTKRYQKLDLG